MGRHKHDFQQEQVLICKDGAIAVLFRCAGRGCLATVTREVRVKRPDSRAVTDEERMARRMAARREREANANSIPLARQDPVDPWYVALGEDSKDYRFPA